jgi:hypothetical protein
MESSLGCMITDGYDFMYDLTDWIAKVTACTTESYQSYAKSYLSVLRLTIFNPLQISLTAQTFTSTHPVGKTIPRIVSSVISVGIFADFLYQEIQIMAVENTRRLAGV